MEADKGRSCETPQMRPPRVHEPTLQNVPNSHWSYSGGCRPRQSSGLARQHALWDGRHRFNLNPEVGVSESRTENQRAVAEGKFKQILSDLDKVDL